ncbi:DEAD/DEAH box helicase [Roseomonas sp. OT10]|uniref:DEAD/DEAH box helicase n=1 Tax=Roseomonas cutis TaxID=2897332 RepID=UPI001E4D7BB1|nr:DEAD/DEAH box helicase [Roseomonas sp. OT10]UFN49663.1 DEAD/DEAH box helicase [Roseomonas sp. OT10]
MPFPVLPAPLAQALTERGYAEPTPVQAAVLEAEAGTRDLLVSAQTGSGKTVAYGLAMASDLLGDGERLPPAGAPLALVVAPTRELALQVRQELSWLYAPAGGRVAAGVGGMDPIAERRELARGAHLVVGTPGRLRDHIERGNLRTESLRVVVLDEADEMLDLGFREELEAILDAAPEGRRTLLFSATMPREIEALAQRYQRDSLRLAIAGEGRQHGDIEHRAMLVAGHELERAVVNVLRLEDPRIAMVFCATRAAVARLHGNLSERGFSAVALSGELTQAERTRALQSLRDGRARICVATDVAARGIDLPDLGLVIHAELPRDPETLLHRSGRTGRAGRKGISLMLVPPGRRRMAERLLAGARLQVAWMAPPSSEAVHARDDERLAAQAGALLAEEMGENDLAVARALAAEHGAEALAAALVRTLRAPLPAPEDLSPIADRGPPRDRDNAAPREGGDGVWFHMNVGRNDRADPRWLLPLLCRRGDVSRQEIGRIRILGDETQFEVSPRAAAHFATAIRRSSDEDEVRIEPMHGQARPSHAPAHRPHRAGPPRRAVPGKAPRPAMARRAR